MLLVHIAQALPGHSWLAFRVLSYEIMCKQHNIGT